MNSFYKIGFFVLLVGLLANSYYTYSVVDKLNNGFEIKKGNSFVTIYPNKIELKTEKDKYKGEFKMSAKEYSVSNSYKYDNEKVRMVRFSQESNNILLRMNKNKYTYSKKDVMYDEVISEEQFQAGDSSISILTKYSKSGVKRNVLLETNGLKFDVEKGKEVFELNWNE